MIHVFSAPAPKLEWEIAAVLAIIFTSCVSITPNQSLLIAIIYILPFSLADHLAWGASFKCNTSQGLVYVIIRSTYFLSLQKYDFFHFLLPFYRLVRISAAHSQSTYVIYLIPAEICLHQFFLKLIFPNASSSNIICTFTWRTPSLLTTRPPNNSKSRLAQVIQVPKLW